MSAAARAAWIRYTRKMVGWSGGAGPASRNAGSQRICRALCLFCLVKVSRFLPRTGAMPPLLYSTSTCPSYNQNSETQLLHVHALAIPFQACSDMEAIRPYGYQHTIYECLLNIIAGCKLVATPTPGAAK